MTQEFDIAIVGGGLVGSSLAVALSAMPLHIALIEAAKPPSSAPAWDERCIALNDASVSIFRAMGLWDDLRAAAEPIFATHISERGRFGVARFAAADEGLDALGYNVPMRAIGAALWSRLESGPVTVICPARVTSVETEARAVRLQMGSPSEDQAAEMSQISARLLAAADGAQSAVRKHLCIAADTRDYAQSAIVSAVKLSRPHQGVAYERFTPQGPLALIPKPGDAASLVWTLPLAVAKEAMSWTDEEYLRRAEETFGGRLGRFLELGRRSSYPLARVVAQRTTAPRCVLLGNAAQSLHPVAAQGFNLGLRDVAAFAERIAGSEREGADPGAYDLLAAYAAEREADRSRVSGFTDLMVRAFSNRVPGLAQARHWGLVAADLLPGVREQLLRQHLGHLGASRSPSIRAATTS